MTISNTIRKAGPFTGNGVTVAFPFTFKVFTQADVLVVLAVTATGVETAQTLGSSYTVALNADQNANPGGTITMLTAPPVGATLTATSQVGNLQSMDLTNAGGFYPRVINDALDRATIQIQQLAEKAARSLRMPVSDTSTGTELPGAAGRANNLLGFDSSGNPMAVAPASQSATALQALLAASTGAAMVGFSQTGVGAVQRNAQDKLRESVSLFDFMTAAQIADVITRTASIDLTTQITAAIAAVYAAGGGKLRAPAGTYFHTGTIPMLAKVQLIGDGLLATIFQSNHLGDGFKSTFPINSSTYACIGIEQLQIKNTNAANTGGAYVDVGGSYLNLFNVAHSGFKFGTIFDQTEIATIRQCQYGGQLSGGAGIWLANGADHTAGGQASFTNRITVQECQINEANNVVGIADDGGYNHSYKDNNFNACSTHLRIAGGNSISIDDNEFESASGTCITFNLTTLAGTNVGPTLGASIRVNSIIPTSGQSCIDCLGGASPLIVEGNLLGNTTAVKIKGLSLVSYFYENGNNNIGSGAMTSGTPTSQFRTMDTGSFVPVIAFGGASVGVAYTQQFGTYTRFGNVITFAIQIALSSKGSSVGPVTISGLPAVAKAGIIQAQAVGFSTGVITSTSVGALIAGSTQMVSLYNASINYSAALSDANLSGTASLNITGQYIAN